MTQVWEATGFMGNRLRFDNISNPLEHITFRENCGTRLGAEACIKREAYLKQRWDLEATLVASLKRRLD